VGISHHLTSKLDAAAADQPRCRAAYLALACCLVAAMLALSPEAALAQKPDPFQSVAPDTAAAKPAPQRRPAPRRHPSGLDETTPSVPIQPQRQLFPSILQDTSQRSYEGVYIGKIQLAYDSPNQCTGGNIKKTLTIKGGQFAYIFNATRDEKIVGSVNPDGSIHARGNSWIGGNELTGKIDQNRFVGRIINFRCRYTLDLTKAE
jgi:hypothetical protein